MKTKCDLDLYNREQISSMKVKQNGSLVTLSHRELREIMFRFNSDTKITLNTNIFYMLLIMQGIHVPGFIPNKTMLRKLGMSLRNINKILPGSFPSEE